jgi:hypothetical protein
MVEGYLKVQSSEMDLAERGNIRKTVSKGRGMLRFITKYARPPFCESPLNIPRHLLQLLAIRNLISNSAERIHCAVGILTMRIRKLRVFTEIPLCIVCKTILSLADRIFV